MSKLKSSDVVITWATEIPRRSFVVYDSSDSVVDCSNLPSMTLQSEKDKCDINNIVAAAVATGFVDHVAAREGQWGVDVSEVVDYQTALNFVRQADEQFMELPANVRARFNNDAGKFLAFIENPDNRDEARKLGLLKPDAPQGNSPAEPSVAPVGGVAAPSQGAQGSKGA